VGLDVYVGPLVRYYTGQWETVVQQWARQQGHRIDVVRPDNPPDAITDPKKVRALVDAWRSQLASQLRPRAVVALDWPEDFETPYVTDKPAWDCYAALLLWAAYDEHPDVGRLQVAPEDWTTDAAFRRSTDPGFTSRYAQLLNDTELWLPAEFGFTFTAPSALGKAIGIGSSPTLLAQLNELNRRTWAADESTLAGWRWEGADHGAPLEISARLAFSVIHSLASAAVQHRLPMLLDY
jgi:hypothetical protein